jgi:hypothetical protein
MIVGSEPTPEQRRAFTSGQGSRGLNAMRNQASEIPIIGKYLERLVDLGERQLEQKENRNAVE